MNAFWKTISYGGILALWLQGSQCLPSSHHSQEDKGSKKMKNSVFLDAPSMDVDSEELYEESGESESDSESSSIVISEVPNFQEVLNRLDRDENSSIFTTRKSDPLSPEFNAQKELCPIGNSRITTINSEPKKLEKNSSSSDVLSFPKNNNPLRDFFQKKIQSFFPKNTEDEEGKAYMTKIFSKTLENISSKERDDAVVFLIEKNIPSKTIEKLFHVPQYMIEAFKISPPLDLDESYESRREKAIELLKNNIFIKKISYIVHISTNDIKNIANKEGIVTKENKTKIDYSAIPQDLWLKMDRDMPLIEREGRAIALLEHNVPLNKIIKIVHISSNNITILARQNGIITRKKKNTFKVHDKIKEYMNEISKDASKEEREKRAFILLKNKVPIKTIAQIAHMHICYIKKLAEKHGIAIRKTAKAFQAPDEIKEYMAEMPQDAPREEKEKRALFLLEHKVPMNKIISIVHMAHSNIKKFAEKYGIAIRKSMPNFQVPDEIKEYMVEMPQDAPREEKEKRALFLLENTVPMGKIASIVHMAHFNIKKLAEKNGITIRQNVRTFQASDEIKEYMVEMPKDATREEKEKRALILLEHKIPIRKIQEIIHMAPLDIRKLAEKYGIAIQKSFKTFQVPDEIKEYMVEIPKNTPKEEREKRALILLEYKVPMEKIAAIIHISTFNIKKLAEKNGISIRKPTHAFQVPDEIKEYMVEIPQDTPKEEKEKRALILLENKVPIKRIAPIVHMDTSNIKKFAEKNDITTRKTRQTLQVPDEIKEYMVEIPQDTPKEEKEKRALILLEHRVPIIKIVQIVHMAPFNIKKFAKKNGIAVRKTPNTFQVPDEIKEYMVEIPKNTPREEKEKRALILLKNKVPIATMVSIVRMTYFDIKQLAEKHQIKRRENKKS